MYYYDLSYDEVVHLPWKVFKWLNDELKDLIEKDPRGIH